MAKYKRTERGLFELYAEDPERADALAFGRRTHTDRRGFLRGAGLAAVAAAVGAHLPFHRNYPAGLIPAALAETPGGFVLDGKDGLKLLSDRPINAETPAHLLDDDITPNSRHFVRDNGVLPAMAQKMDASGWTLSVDGEVDNPLTLTLGDLKSKFKAVKLKLQLECGGNGRACSARRRAQPVVRRRGRRRWACVMPNHSAAASASPRSTQATTAWTGTCPATRKKCQSRAACPSPRRWSPTRSSPSR
jgi:DMSO/TMAO reductase YedYZ molybdopterin-dependent catalytic subunit